MTLLSPNLYPLICQPVGRELLRVKASDSNDLGGATEAPGQTRERLLRVAMRHFALHGIDGVALKTISEAAGNRNKSAVGYHFTSKRGLVEAALQRLHDDLAPRMVEVLASFEGKLDAGDELIIDEVVLELLTPILRLYATVPYGPDGVRVLARIMHDPIDEVPTALRQSVGQVTSRAIDLLHRLLPRKRRADLRHHVHHALMATVNGLALQQQFVSGAGVVWTRALLADLFLSYVAYVVAGLASGPLNIEPASVAAWKARLLAPPELSCGRP
jgi:AcrR family transcriptional regulator